MKFMNAVQDGNREDDISFINKDIMKSLDFQPKNLEFFFELTELDKKTTTDLCKILDETRRLPAALEDFHGNYTGGLFDHTLLVVNYVYLIYNSLKNKPWLKKVILTALCHDFGKIQYYGFKLELKNRKIEIDVADAIEIRSELKSKFNLTGKDWHVESGIAVIRKYIRKHKTLFDDAMYLAIAFHHGSWSRYQPQKMNELASIIHVADMIVSQILRI